MLANPNPELQRKETQPNPVQPGTSAALKPVTLCSLSTTQKQLYGLLATADDFTLHFLAFPSTTRLSFAAQKCSFCNPTATIPVKLQFNFFRAYNFQNRGLFIYFTRFSPASPKNKIRAIPNQSQQELHNGCYS